jgi:hypothetical protein
MRAGRTLWLVIAVATLLLAGCSLRLKIALFNNSGRNLVLHAERVELPVASGAFAQFFYPGTEERWAFRLSTPECDYEYEVPRTLENFPWQWDIHQPVKVQVEPDLSVHLLPPPTSGVEDVERYAAFQRDGFPLHPFASSCSPQKPDELREKVCDDIDIDFTGIHGYDHSRLAGAARSRGPTGPADYVLLVPPPMESDIWKVFVMEDLRPMPEPMCSRVSAPDGKWVQCQQSVPAQGLRLVVHFLDDAPEKYAARMPSLMRYVTESVLCPRPAGKPSGAGA